MGVGGERHGPAALPPREEPGTHFIGGWVGPRAGLDGCRIYHPVVQKQRLLSCFGKAVSTLFHCRCVLSPYITGDPSGLRACMSQGH
jgi:hypothetical protein